MSSRRFLSVENLEQRIVLDAFGLVGPALPNSWQAVIVELNDNTSDARLIGNDVVGRGGGQLGHIYNHAIKGFSAQMPVAAIQALQNNPLIKRVELDIQMQAFADSLTQVLPTGVDRINGDQQLEGDPIAIDVNIAIIDSGIDTHDDLNVVGGTHFYTTGNWRKSVTVQDDNYDDDNGHGSHVAGIAAARDNGIGVVGVAPGARLWSVKVLDENLNGSLSSIIAGIDWVTSTRTDGDPTNDIEVANMSLGGLGASTAYHNAIKSSVNAGIVYVVAAGNSYRDILGQDFQFGTSDDTIPAVYPEVATISAFADTDGKAGNAGPVSSLGYADDTFADFSNYSNSTRDSNDKLVSWYDDNNHGILSPGLGIDLMMPGVDIYSTYKDGGYAVGSGTSAAAPHAAGLAALYIAQNGRAHNAEEVYTIRQALIVGGKGWRDPDEGLYFPDPNYIPDSPDNHTENLGWVADQGPIDHAPTVEITSPVEGTSIAENVEVTATATDDNSVTQVEFVINGISLGTDTVESDGWSMMWDTTGLSDGVYEITAIATDTAGQTTSSKISVMLDNVDDVPTVALDSDGLAGVLSGTITVTADAWDDRGVDKVEFFVGGESIGVDTNATDGWSAEWDTTQYVDGYYAVTAIATDSGQRTATSIPIEAEVNNAVAPTMHVADLDGSSVLVRNRWTATSEILIQDAQGKPVVRATVTGSWSDGVTGTSEAVTDADGICTVVKTRISTRTPMVRFNVTNVSGLLKYAASDNVDPDGDSNGTSIVIASPLSASRYSVGSAQALASVFEDTDDREFDNRGDEREIKQVTKRVQAKAQVPQGRQMQPQTRESSDRVVESTAQEFESLLDDTVLELLAKGWK
ncbi:S8 family serine peptidase [Novipirellula artificiosorum]|uniref:Subtilisin E n=1 Tax=Novipirellula artificiosorum TaxID=2528016 RepID=A0A5C6DSU1_9BACT|nr:S8 family serine peptidase [Novipirellula artificiosorum]TWU39790.1 Subtilisin E precursor [Novipirellula artificiosorum]